MLIVEQHNDQLPVGLIARLVKLDLHQRHRGLSLSPAIQACIFQAFLAATLINSDKNSEDHALISLFQSYKWFLLVVSMELLFSYYRNIKIKSNQINSSQMLVFVERGKLEDPEKNLSQGRKLTNSAHIHFQSAHHI